MSFENGIGIMPDGEERNFANENEYEDAFFDELYEMSNEFEYDCVEDYVA